MLYEFIAENHDELINRTRAMVAARPWPPASVKEMENGVPLFLTQLVEALRREERSEPYSDAAIGATATKHGEDLLSQGFTVSQVVHDYGDVCRLPGPRAGGESVQCWGQACWALTCQPGHGTG